MFINPVKEENLRETSAKIGGFLKARDSSIGIQKILRPRRPANQSGPPKLKPETGVESGRIKLGLPPLFADLRGRM
jgi:hypothetical protein